MTRDESPPLRTVSREQIEQAKAEAAWSDHRASCAQCARPLPDPRTVLPDPLGPWRLVQYPPPGTYCAEGSALLRAFTEASEPRRAAGTPPPGLRSSGPVGAAALDLAEIERRHTEVEARVGEIGYQPTPAHDDRGALLAALREARARAAEWEKRAVRAQHDLSVMSSRASTNAQAANEERAARAAAEEAVADWQEEAKACWNALPGPVADGATLAGEIARLVADRAAERAEWQTAEAAAVDEAARLRMRIERAAEALPPEMSQPLEAVAPSWVLEVDGQRWIVRRDDGGQGYVSAYVGGLAAG